MEELRGGEVEKGMAPGGEDFGHGDEDEGAQVHAGMGEGGSAVLGGFRHPGADADEVDVDGAVGV